MRAPGSWLLELQRLGLLVLVSAGLGWLVGRPWLALAIALVGITLYWLRQLLRVHRWLENPEQLAPEGVGIWGEVYDEIYHLQRRNRESYQRLQSTVDYLQDSFAAMRDGVVMVDGTGAIEWSNTAAQKMLGLQIPRDQGQALLNLVRIPAFNQYFLSGDFSEPLKLNLGNERRQIVQFEITTFGEGDRLVFARDITKVAQLEQMRRDFVGNVSHELRTPLTVIKGYLETILAYGDQLEPRFVRPLQQMDQQAQRMENLLKDLLWLSRIESVESTPKHKQVDVPALLQELHDELFTTYPERRLDLELECDCKVLGDYRELHSAVSNLVINAFKYSPEDTPVTLRWQRWGELEGQKAALSVVDRGMGIAESHLPRLTERFYRVDDSRSSQTGGTGLGLAIVKHVAASHQAELQIESRLGEGSTFRMVFPLP
ncbi:phosphate regulon sensor histidine kinase PhoR [Parahaliea maris]|uniref:Phosphate regulon sensor protein PhoR n=1 Tax=Parahaliea maris TaxID=2716870 RepID=A0A5C9A6C5_9GAMM|nr:phosphate regulon sensor histidine kinase PhoR [Parahaliea maris]TXS95599.1 phosphate regulon sensor histidine kinase PhoR [Parahaliea maris]